MCFTKLILRLNTMVHSYGIGHWFGRSQDTLVLVSQIGIKGYTKYVNLRIPKFLRELLKLSQK